MPKLLIFDAFTLLIREKNVAIYALLRCKIFSLKIWVCKIFDKFHVWCRVVTVFQCTGLGVGCIVGGAERVDRLTEVLLGLSKDIGQVLGCTTEIQSFIESADGEKIKGSIHNTQESLFGRIPQRLILYPLLCHHIIFFYDRLSIFLK